MLWQAVSGSAEVFPIRQAYLSTDPECTVRIRISGASALITIKGKTTGMSREEFEYPVPVDEARLMMHMARTTWVIKDRHVIMYKGYRWEVDEFHGGNEGLLLAEVELEFDGELPERPDWIEKEVTGDSRYYNLQLAINPINKWQ